MKKSTWLLIIAAVLAVGVIIGGVIGFLLGGDGTHNSGDPHTHAFTRKDTNADYLKDKATCQSPAMYYYSCACGEEGTETFTSGDLGSHSYENRVCTVCGTLLPSEGIVFQSNGRQRHSSYKRPRQGDQRHCRGWRFRSSSGVPLRNEGRRRSDLSRHHTRNRP